MAEKSQPVFRDFLGTDQRAELSVTDSVRISQNSPGIVGREDGEDSTRACSKYTGPSPPTAAGPLAFPNSLDPTPENLRHTKAGVAAHHGSAGLSYKESEYDHGKKRDIITSRNSLRDALHFSSEAMENSRPSKCSRFKEIEDPRKEPGDPSSLSGDLRLSMQPPRLSPSAPLWMQSSVFKSDLSTVEPSMPANLNAALSVGRRLNRGGCSSEKPPPKENIVGFSSLPQPPADEGSRTGLQGAGIAHLLDTCPATLVAGDPSAQGAAPSHSKVPSQNARSDCAVPSLNQIAAPTTRQLTIFYGGQAHVFDDVSSEKADAIMLLAGSNGRSWSTTYAYRPSISNRSVASECLELERQKEKPGCEMSVNRTESHALPSNVQSLLQGLARAGVGHVYTGHQFPPQALTSAGPSAELRNASENLVATADASNVDGSVLRMSSSPAAYNNSSGKEPGNQGHQWM